MKIYEDECGNIVKAANYTDAAEKLYGVEKDANGNRTLYVTRRRKHAKVSVYAAGSKVGTYYGVQAATPKAHTLRKIM